MTPLEVAEGLERRHAYDKKHHPPASPLDRNAAATIREIEAKLKIATEALEPFVRAADKLDGQWAGDDWRWNDSVRSNVTVADIRKASQALACIKEV